MKHQQRKRRNRPNRRRLFRFELDYAPYFLDLGWSGKVLQKKLFFYIEISLQMIRQAYIFATALDERMVKCVEKKQQVH